MSSAKPSRRFFRRMNWPIGDSFDQKRPIDVREERVDGIQEQLFGAKIGVERKPARCLAGRAQISEYIGAAESIHRLLWVADEKQRVLSAGENPAEDFVLDRVSILEFIDQCGAILCTERFGERRPGLAL